MYIRVYTLLYVYMKHLVEDDIFLYSDSCTNNLIAVYPETRSDDGEKGRVMSSACYIHRGFVDRRSSPVMYAGKGPV